MNSQHKLNGAPISKAEENLQDESLLQTLKFEFEMDTEKKSTICNSILRSLPEWFGLEDSIVEYTEDVKSLPFLTITVNSKVIGFFAIKENYTINADLFVLGIRREYHARGIGSRAISFIRNYYRENGFQYLSVKTLSERSDNPDYRKTRDFYKKNGFVPFEEFPTLWGEENPCPYMVKPI